MCELKPHVLRYWEQEFSQLKPSKRRGNRRYYLRDQIFIVLKIKQLLYEQGYTISGARQKLDEKPPPPLNSKLSQQPIPQQKIIQDVISDLEATLEILNVS